MEVMHNNLENADNRSTSNQSKKLSRILAFIAVVTIISALFDGTEYINRVFFEGTSNLLWPTIIVIGFIGSFFTAFYFLIMKR